MNISVHRVTSISIDDAELLAMSTTYVRHIVIKSISNGVEQSDEINLFSDDEDALYIGEMV